MTAHVQHRPPPKVKRGLVPALVFIGMVVAILSSLGAPLVPDLAQNYHVSLITAQWTLTIAFLASAIATPTMGRVGDGPGRRKMIIGGLAVVVVGCLLAALPLGFPALLLGRALQGIGLGLTPLTMATARDALGKGKATSAVAMLSLTTVVGVGLGYWESTGLRPRPSATFPNLATPSEANRGRHERTVDTLTPTSWAIQAFAMPAPAGSVVGLLVFGGWDHADGGVEAAGVVPIDPAGSGSPAPAGPGRPTRPRGPGFSSDR